MALEEYNVRLATTTDFNSIVTLVSEDFVCEEPMHQSFIAHNNACFEDDLSQSLPKEIKEYFRKILLMVNPSLVACEVSTGQVVGFLVLQTEEFVDLEDKYFRTCNSPQKKQRGAALTKLNRSYYDIRQNAYLRGHFQDTARHMLLMYLVVQKCYRRKGLATMLLQQSIEYAKNHEVDLLYGMFTSEGSKRIAEKLGMTSFFHRDLMDIVDHQGQPAFADVGENNVVSVMGIKIS